MKRPLYVCALVLFFAPCVPCGAQATVDKTSLLLQRIATKDAGGDATVAVGKVPDGLPSVPLPGADILGGVRTRTQSTPFVSLDRFELYYNGDANALAKYEATLTAAGWKARPVKAPFDTGGGFETSIASSSDTTYCKSNAPNVTVGTGNDPKDLRVSVNPSGTTMDVLCGGPIADTAQQMIGMFVAPLPTLRAPKGAKISPAISIPNLKSRALIEGGTSPEALLDAFSSQLQSAGWDAGAKTAGDEIASQTFRHVDEKKTPWQCVLTIYAVSGKPGDYIAFIDSTNLSLLEP